MVDLKEYGASAKEILNALDKVTNEYTALLQKNLEVSLSMPT